MAKGQRQRKNKTSKGERKSSQRVKLNDVQKILLGHGMVHVTLRRKKK